MTSRQANLLGCRDPFNNQMPSIPKGQEYFQTGTGFRGKFNDYYSSLRLPEEGANRGDKILLASNAVYGIEPGSNSTRLDALPTYDSPEPAPHKTEPITISGPRTIQTAIPGEAREVLNSSLYRNNKFLKHSRMNFSLVPDSEQQSLKATLRSGLEQLKHHVADGEAAALVDGANQRLYVVKRIGDSFDFQYVTKVSTGAKGFGRPMAVKSTDKNKPRKTPDGLFRVYATVNGNPGQIIKAGTPEHAYVRTPNSGKKAEMLTKALMLEDVEDQKAWKMTAQAKGIALHGTNREGRLGSRGSDGCIRMSNWDVLVLDRIKSKNGGLYVFVQKKQDKA